MGHGKDACDPKGNLVIKQVPLNCTYVTISDCGLLSYSHPDKVLKAFLDPVNKEIWQKVDLEGLKRILKGIIDTSTIHIHKPGDRYVVSKYNPVAEHYMDKDGKYIYFKHIAEKKYYILNPSGIYKLSTEIEAGSIPQKKKIERTIFPHKISGKVKDFDSFKVEKDDFLSFFKYALYPKLKTLEMQREYYTPIEIEKINERYTEFTSILMDKFPGVHYNFLCRVVDPNCTKTALQRRVDSAEMYGTLPATFQRTIKENNKENVESYFQTLVEGKSRPIQNVSAYYEKIPPTLQTPKIRFVYDKQLVEEAKRRIGMIFQPNDYSIVKSMLDKIDNYSIAPFLTDLEGKCRGEASKAAGSKNSVLQDCLNDLESRKIWLLNDGIYLTNIFAYKDDVWLERHLKTFDDFLGMLSTDTLEKNKDKLLASLEKMKKETETDKNSNLNKGKLETIYSRVLDILKKYGIAPASAPAAAAAASSSSSAPNAIVRYNENGLPIAPPEAFFSHNSPNNKKGGKRKTRKRGRKLSRKRRQNKSTY
jgi:hypothetical protein